MWVISEEAIQNNLEIPFLMEVMHNPGMLGQFRAVVKLKKHHKFLKITKNFLEKVQRSLEISILGHLKVILMSLKLLESPNKLKNKSLKSSAFDLIAFKTTLRSFK